MLLIHKLQISETQHLWKKCQKNDGVSYTITLASVRRGLSKLQTCLSKYLIDNGGGRIVEKIKYRTEIIFFMVKIKSVEINHLQNICF